MNIAIIPARGGSKRIPRKNIKMFLGKPMITYSIEAAKKCGLFDQIIVSTDDEEIATISKQAGADIPFLRPQSLADDHTTTITVIRHVIEELQEQGITPENITCIYPCAPMLTAKTIRQAHDLLKNHADKYIFPIAEFPSPPQRGFKLSPEGQIESFFPQYQETRTQDLETMFYDAGQFYCAQTQTWLDEDNIHGAAAGVKTPSWQAVDIDNEDDWARAEIQYKLLHKMTDAPA